MKAAAHSLLFQLDPVLFNTEQVGEEPGVSDAGSCWEMPLQRWHWGRSLCWCPPAEAPVPLNAWHGMKFDAKFTVALGHLRSSNRQQGWLWRGRRFVWCSWKRIWSDSGLLESAVKFSQLLATELWQTLKLVNLLHLCRCLPAQTLIFFVCFHRLYNQLAEVKIRNEEKTRQETYAKNREKAKEFQKVIVCYSVLLLFGVMISLSFHSE